MDDFKLPLLTKHGHEIMVLWASFPVKNQNGDVGDIGFVGKFINSWNDAESPIVKKSKINFKKLDIDDIDKTSNKLIKRNEELKLSLDALNIEIIPSSKNIKALKK